MTSYLLLGLAVITFLNRYAFLSHAIQYLPGPRVQRFLSYSSYSVLTAIWTPLVFQLSSGDGFTLAGWDYLIAASLAAGMTIAKVRAILVVLASTGLFFALRFWVMPILA